ncbi:MBL fold metallo-hydrolase [Rhodovulum visakhapatnamense]|uniref:MBL fold metallo-hydrolase n=1 Tax=Rhodovulum visakhapatnamense TaxID=364297 RepID=UPI001924050E|nr:MBL fold metallo-hydrolase [Rhodovulum visakhapatnamense]MBL3569515.1 MBL fold metallo-hydrolase [Rhodovulum visakhapatnamense]
MARLTAISGLGRKSAAIFLIEMSGRRVLFDLGDGLEPGDRPDLTGIGRVDAVVLSHAHEDHAGALDRLDEVGDPPVLATARTLGFLPERLRAGRARVLPERGRVDLMGLDLTLGRAGHAPGGVWLHVATPAGGLLYTGDICPEAPRLPVDPLPEAATLVLDASYGDREGRLPTRSLPWPGRPRRARDCAVRRRGAAPTWWRPWPGPGCALPPMP